MTSCSSMQAMTFTVTPQLPQTLPLDLYLRERIKTPDLPPDRIQG